MVSTRFTDLVGCTRPLQLAGMGGVSSPELAAAAFEVEWPDAPHRVPEPLSSRPRRASRGTVPRR